MTCGRGRQGREGQEERGAGRLVSRVLNTVSTLSSHVSLHHLHGRIQAMVQHSMRRHVGEGENNRVPALGEQLNTSTHTET